MNSFEPEREPAAAPIELSEWSLMMWVPQIVRWSGARARSAGSVVQIRRRESGYRPSCWVRQRAIIFSDPDFAGLDAERQQWDCQSSGTEAL